MPLDPSIILGVKGVELPDLGELQKNAMQTQMLGMQQQNMQREYRGQQALRDAYKNNTTIGPDGTPAINNQGLVSDVAKTDTMLAAKTGQELGANQLAMQQQKMKMYGDQVEMGKKFTSQVPTDPQTPLPQKQTAWTQMKADSIKYGLPNAAQLPDQYPGDSFVQNMQMHLMSAEEQLANHNKNTDQTTERAKANASLAEAGLPTLPAIGAAPGQGGGTAAPGNPSGTGGFSPPPKMRQKAMEDYNTAVSGSRQQADATQALKDIQAGQKLSEITKLAPGGDLNKLNNQQTKLAITELVKMAGGTAPTESELEQMTPNNYAQKYAGLLQNMTNKSQPANAGEFIQQGIDYAGGIQKLGAQKLTDRANEFADRQRPYLGEQQYKMVKSQIANEHKSNSPMPTTVNMLAPDGKVRAVPSDQVDAATAAGGKRI